MTPFKSFFEISLRRRQIIRQTVLYMCQVDVLLGINSTRSVYRKNCYSLVVKVLSWCVVVGILHTFDNGSWYRGRGVLHGLSKYETNSIRLLMVIQFVNFVHYV